MPQYMVGEHFHTELVFDDSAAYLRSIALLHSFYTGESIVEMLHSLYMIELEHRLINPQLSRTSSTLQSHIR